MSNIKMNNKKAVPTIVVGCGGSGLATIQKLNRMLASNPALADRMGDEMFYLAIDTDIAPLTTFSENISEDMNGRPAPFIAEIQLSRGIRQLKQITDACMVHPFKGKSDSPALDRIKEHWWFRRGKPFEAPAVTNLMTGAGQCPPASYCLAWFRMDEIAKQVHVIIDHIKSKFGRLVTGEDINPIANINVFLVAGLAGGTGRGVWELVAYKIREIFEKEYELPVQPIGVFFTEGVFADVKKRYPHQIPALKVNSLTGLSELSSLMKTGRSGDDSEIFRMRMPNMRTPQRELTDVLGIDNSVAGRTSPVHSAYLVCGDRDEGRLDGSKQFYEMAGAALYTMIVNSNINSTACNDDDPFLSFASNTFEVDVTHLRSYFENYVRGVALDRLAKVDVDQGDAVREFLANNPLVKPISTIKSAMGDKAGTLLQRVTSFLLEDAYGDSLNQLAACDADGLIKMNPKQGMEAVKDILGEATAAEIKAAFTKALASMGDVNKLLDDAVFNAYKGETGAPSIGRAKAFASQLANNLKVLFDGLPKKSPEINAEAAQSDARLHDACEYVMTQVKEASKRKAIEMLRGDPYFTAAEIQSLICVTSRGEFDGDIARGIVAMNYTAIREALGKAIAGWTKHLSSIVAGYEKLEGYVATAKAKFDVLNIAAAGGDETDDPYAVLFTDPTKIEDSLPSDNDLTIFYRRRLVPIMTRAEVRSLAEGALRTREGLDELIQATVKDVAEIGSRDVFLRKLMDAVRANVYIEDGFLEQNFSFCKVLKRNLAQWNKYLVGISGDDAKRKRICKKLENYLGVAPEFDKQDNVYRLPDIELLLPRIIAILADDCKPWWKIVSTGKAATSDAGKVMKTVLISERYSRNGYVSKEDLEHDVSEMLGGELITTYDRQTAGGGASPFMIVTYANQILLSADFDDIISLDWTHSDTVYVPTVDRWLQNAERKDGESIFSTADRNKGCGYISPIFVNNPALAAARWHPWLKGDFGTVEDEDAALKALLYAFLGNGTCEEIAKLESVGWKFPLIKIGPRQQFMIARKALKWDGEKAVEDPNCAWLVDEKICVSLANLHEYLNGNGKTGLNGKLVEKDVAEGKALRRGIGEEESNFMDKLIKGKFGPEFFSNLCAARDKWFAAQRDAAKRGKNGRKEDAETWQKLIKLSERLAKV